MTQLKRIFLSRTLGILPVLLLLFIVLSLVESRIYSSNNIITIFRNASMNMVMAAGMTMVIITGGIDLSVGSILAVAAVVGLSVSRGEYASMSMPIALLIGAGAGLVTAFSSPSSACRRLSPLLAP